MAHHASASGYDQIARVRSDEYLPNSDTPGLFMRALLRALRQRIQASGNQWYNRAAMHTELGVMRRQLRERNEIIHFLYGENSFRYSGAFREMARRRNNRLVATYHTPVYRLEQLVLHPEHLASLDAIVVMSECQRPFFQNVVPEHKVHFVPHGINTDYFKPLTEAAAIEKTESRSQREFRCVTVGHHLRDYDVLAGVAKRCSREGLNVRFDVVAWPDRVAPVANLPNVHCNTGISDADLLALYQNADLLMLPLLDATANNTLLEGMGCGLPVLSTDLQGVHDYAPEEILLAPHGDSDQAFELLRDCVKGQVNLECLAKSSRDRAESLSWERVRQQLEEIYQQI